MSDSNEKTAVGTVARAIFGIIMIVIYVGMGVLMFINFFQWGESWLWPRLGLGAVFTVYGLWRAYRQFRGVDYYS
jgi:hypothetical protein